MTAPLARIDGGVNTSVRHDSARGHLTGQALYVDDVPAPAGTLDAALVLSPHAHARIVSIDASRALAYPGVVAVVTADDIPGKNDIAPIRTDEPALAQGVVLHEGQAVAAVAATSVAAARAAAKLVDVAYEPLPPVLSVEEALAREDYVCPPIAITRGDLDAGFAASAHRLTGEVSCGGQEHFYLEGQVAIATPGDSGDMHVLSSTQHPTEVQHGVARLLGVPFAAVTSEVRRMGGAFGGKESQATSFAGIAALLAWKTRKPVKLRLPRDDDMRVTGKRHPFLIRWDVGCNPEGKILALDMMLASESGHVADQTPAVLTRALCHADNCYWLPNVRLRGYPCRTNTVSNTAFRGFGGPQGMFGIEAVVDMIARTLKIPTDAVRAKNYYGVGQNDVTPYLMRVEDNLIDRVMEELDHAADLKAWRAEVDAFNANSPVLKKGLATMPVKFGISFNKPTLNQAGALVHVYTDGSVLLSHGGTEMGQGLFIKVAQVVAETFQVDIGHVRLAATSTGKVPNTSPTAASSGSDLNGMAARDAALQIRTRMSEVAAQHFGVEPSAIVFKANRVYAGNRSLSFAELAHMSWDKRVSLSAAGFYKTPKIHWDFATNTGRPFFYFTYGAAAAEVAIDTLTGETRVLRAELIEDCGRSLNPAIDLGQIEGAFVQGMGWLTCEELVWDEKGRLRTVGPSTYKIPGSRDVPPIFRARLLKDAPNREDTIFHSKAVGEPPLMLAISVWLAIRDAVASLGPKGGPKGAVPQLDAPATPERVLMACEAMRAGAQGG
jgi:xanthine dehydrogenase large subunit